MPDVYKRQVALVGYVVDGVLIRDVRAQVGAAVGDMVLISAVHIGAAGYGLVVLRYAEQDVYKRQQLSCPYK